MGIATEKYFCFLIINLTLKIKSMKHYYLNNNQQANGDYEVHVEGCIYMPSIFNREALGVFDNCKDAVARAKFLFPYRKINGCFYCCRPCHTS